MPLIFRPSVHTGRHASNFWVDMANRLTALTRVNYSLISDEPDAADRLQVVT